MKVKFLGGAREVGRLGILLSSEHKTMLIDYGLNPTQPPTYPDEAPHVDFAILSHAHLDHSGMIPWIASRYGADIYSTPVTKDLSRILYEDMLKIAEANGYPFPYMKDAVNIAMERFREIKIGDKIEMDGFSAKIHSAGHIPGSIMVELENYDTLFTCDINTIDTSLMKGTRARKVKNLFIEGTYAGTEHPKRRELERKFLDEVEDTVNRGGKVIIPAFAVGRTQEMAMLLYERGHEIWIDGMGSRIADIMLNHSEYIRDASKLHAAMESANIVYSSHGRKLALRSGIVVTTSGMLNGGPVLWYIDKIRDDPKSAVMITGYQVEGTNGRRLLERREINIYGVVERVNCRVEFFDFSAHAGHSQLVKFIKDSQAENVFIFHSENPELLAEEVDANVIIPSNGEEIEIKG